ncbi:GGDEF domain-containing protein [Lysobacter sp. A3-1-A15]|uniref:GGDEF domain-containing protein n=1 Tax=Novilysobacter viscosus TaxID=3098602 RepID=UPI002EDA5362
MQRTGELRSALGQLENAHARLRESSQRDGLTGLHNRSHFRERLLEILERGEGPVSLLMIDLDHFKSINDRHGHLVGDDCLRWAARTIGQALRPHEALLARFGGEEFVAALPGMDTADAADVAQSLRRALHAHPCASGPHIVPISASIGVHRLPRGAGIDGDEAIDHALQGADQALYAAKAGGRDCVRVAGALV